MKRNLLLICALIINVTLLFSQNTVGLLSYNESQVYQGYTLIYPHNQPNVYLINNCGEIVHSWTDEDNFRPGNTAYLRADGTLVKTKREASIAGDAIWAGGGGAIVEIRDWGNNLLWSFERNNENERLHHDIEPLPNGNILMISWEHITMEEAVQAGRDPSTLAQGELWAEKIIEVDPTTDLIVWEWRVMDHIIQDFDPTKDNFGVVSEHNELININWDQNDGKADWLHANALDYNAELDQIMISIPYFDELWIIDHSTTTVQASGHTGGFTNHGGDLIYRQGNPEAYGQGTDEDQLLFFPHDTHWTNEFIDQAHPDYGKILVFNNRAGEDFSTAEKFRSSWDMYISDYEQIGGVFPPFEFTQTINHPDPTAIHSTGLSSVQLLPNGNVLICAGRPGYIVELNMDEEIVWEYKTPLRAGQPVAQGEVLEIGDNMTFRAFKYPVNYDAFTGRDLSAKGFIESEPDETYCDRLVATFNPSIIESKIYPNPAADMIHLTWDSGEIIEIKVIDALGRVRLTTEGNGGMKFLDVSGLESNIYSIVINGHLSQRLAILK